MNNERELNRLDEKWAHPEIVQDDTYTIPHDFSAAIALKGKTLEEANAANEAWRKPLFDMFWADACPEEKDNYEWTEVFSEGGCPEEPERPVRMLIRSPKERGKKPLPGILFLHGGGLMGGTPECMCAMVSKFMLEGKIRAIVVMPEYRTAPVTQYPGAVNDAHAAWLWMHEHAEGLGIDPKNVVISGGSSGGQVAVALGFRLKSAGYPYGMPKGIIPLTPVMDDVAANASNLISFATEEGQLMGWDRNGVMLSGQLYLGDRFADPTLPPEAIPNRATPEDCVGYPPTWLPCCAELDVARDTVYRFAQMLSDADVFCDCHVWGGASHLITGGHYETDLCRRVWDVIEGSFRDALKYDMRRPWACPDPAAAEPTAE